MTRKNSPAVPADSDHVVLLSDWMDEDPMRVMPKLKADSGFDNYHEPTAGEFFRDVRRNGLRAALDKRSMWQRMRMSWGDLSDLSAATLTDLTNGTTPAGNWSAAVRPGKITRLRFINGAGDTLHDVRIPGLSAPVPPMDPRQNRTMGDMSSMPGMSMLAGLRRAGAGTVLVRHRGHRLRRRPGSKCAASECR